MKIYKVFEKREVRLDLTQDDIDDIVDVFIMYISDKYKLELVDNPLSLINIDIPDYEDIGYYSVMYRDDTWTDENSCVIEILRNNKWNLQNFNKDMVLLKNRLNNLGYVSSGSAFRFEDKFEYKLIVYKPMFPVRKKIKDENL